MMPKYKPQLLLRTISGKSTCYQCSTIRSDNYYQSKVVIHLPMKSYLCTGELPGNVAYTHCFRIANVQTPGQILSGT